MRRLLALALGFALALLGAEATYRLTRGGEQGPTTNPRYVTADPRLGWRYRAGARARHRTEEFDVSVEIGARGFRGEWPTPDPDRRRVLVLGDSFAFGWGVDAGASLCGVLAELEPDWQVFNAAVSGYGTDQQVLLLETLRAELLPDAVVTVFCRNDLEENLSKRAHGRRKPWFTLGERGELELHGVPVEEGWLEGRSQLVRALRKQLWPVERVARGEEHAWRMTEALLEALAQRAGAPLFVVSDQERLAAQAARSAALHHLDTREALRELGSAAHFPRDGHWTPAAHRAVGEHLARTLRAVLGPGAH